MKNKKSLKSFNVYGYLSIVFGAIVLLFTSACKREEFDNLLPAPYPNTAEVFIDGFSGGLDYSAFSNSKLTAFDVDEEESFEGTSSIRFDVPNVNDPKGTYAGGVFRDLGGRNLTGYDALTFYAKASQAGSIDLIGFGTDFLEDKFTATAVGLSISTQWEKYTIPIPDPSKLVQEKGLLIFAEGPENGSGYTVWIDNVKYEKLGTLAHPRPAIQNGEEIIQQSYIGFTIELTGLTQTYNLANGVNQSVSAAPGYFEFNSSDTTVATVTDLGIVSIIGTGTSTITATLAGVEASGSLTIESLGDFLHAPTPMRDPNNVISIFSDAYNNVPVDFYNGYFAPYQTTLGGADLNIDGDNIIKYTYLNFVATEFKNPTLNLAEMTHFHVDIYVEDDLDPGDFIRIQLGDFGPDAVFGGGDDSNGSTIIDGSNLSTGNWTSLDLPLAGFTGLTNRSNLAQIFFVSDGTIFSILVDNMYFYKL